MGSFLPYGSLASWNLVGNSSAVKFKLPVMCEDVEETLKFLSLTTLQAVSFFSFRYMYRLPVFVGCGDDDKC